MNPVGINATLIVQLVTFAVLVALLYKYLYGPLKKIMEERKAKIADGLAAAERGKEEIALAQKRAAEMLREAKEKAAEILAAADRRGNEMREEAQATAREEADRILLSARAEIEVETNRAREALKERVASLALEAAERILQKELDMQAHRQLLDRVVGEL